MSNIVELIDAEIAGLEQKIAALKAAKAALGGVPAKKAKAAKTDGRKGRVWTEDQKALISLKAKARAAAKAAGGPVVTRAKANVQA